MAQTFYEELNEALRALKKSEAEKVYQALENHEFPPIPMKLSVVMQTVRDVAKKHQMTKGEATRILQGYQQNLTTEELMEFSKMWDNKETE